jgi:pyridoxine 5-phosphate synthase
MHIAARIEDAYTAFRARIARLSGKIPTVVAFRGYGSTASVRILARVLFIDPDPDDIRCAAELGADAIELHTGTYAHHPDDPATLTALREATVLGRSLGLAVHAGHGLTVANVGPVAAIDGIEELNIGHSIVSRAVFLGLAHAVREVRDAMDLARARRS